MIEEMDTIEEIDDEMRELVEKHWPWLLVKLPPQRTLKFSEYEQL
jgi:hypothetical protein